jgi:hypothetical protein
MLGLILPVRKKPQLPSTKEGFRDMYFKGQQSNEELICFCRKHWMQALSHIGLWILFAITESILFFGVRKVSGILAGNFGLQILYVGVVILMTVYLHKTFLRIFSYFLSTVIFTSTRVVLHKKALFLTDSHEVLDVTKIQDVKKYQKGILNNLLDYGDLVITLSSEKASHSLTYVPNVNFHFRCLSRIKKDAGLKGRLQNLRQEEAKGLKTFSRKKSEEMLRLERQQVEDATKKITGEIVKSAIEMVTVQEPIPLVPSYNDLRLDQDDVKKTL